VARQSAWRMKAALAVARRSPQAGLAVARRNPAEALAVQAVGSCPAGPGQM